MKNTLLVGLAVSGSITLHAQELPPAQESIPQQYGPMMEWSKPELLTLIKHLNLHGITFLDVTTKAHWATTELESKRVNLVWLNVVYAVDRGYGYSSGPFYNTLTLLPTGNGALELYELILPGRRALFWQGLRPHPRIRLDAQSSAFWVDRGLAP